MAFTLVSPKRRALVALIATIALTVGFFAWVKTDPAIPPPAAPARESRNEFPNCHSQSAGYAVCVPAGDLIDDQPLGLISLRG